MNLRAGWVGDLGEFHFRRNGDQAAFIIAAHVAAETAALIDRVEDLEEALRNVIPEPCYLAASEEAVKVARAALAGKEGE